MQDTNDNENDSTGLQEILEVLAKLDEITGDDGGGRIYPDDHYVSHRGGHFEHDGVRIEWGGGEDEFVEVYRTKHKSSFNFNVGPYSVDWKRDSRLGREDGLSVVHRDENPEAFEQTAHLGNYFDNWNSEEVAGGQSKTLVLDEEELVDAIIQSHHEGESLTPLRVRWRTEWESNQEADIGRYDTSTYTRKHAMARPSEFTRNEAYISDRRTVVRNCTEEHELDLDEVTEAEIREKGYGDELERWFDEADEVARSEVRDDLIRGAEELEKRVRGLELDEVVYE